MLNAIFGFGGIANAALTAKQASNGRSRNVTRKNIVVAPKRTLLYNNPAELEDLKKQWAVNDTTYNTLQGKETDELDELFKHYLKTKKLTFIDFSKKRIAKEGFNVIDKATSHYLDLLKSVMKEKAILMLAGKSEDELRKLIAQTNKLISQASIDASQAPNDKRIDLIVEKEHFQFFLTLLKDALQMKKNNKYVPSTTEAPTLNTSYLKERNFNVRKGFNKMVLESQMREGNPLTNTQLNARRMVAMKMARGQPVTMGEKIQAGIVAFPKPTTPRPTVPKPLGPKPNRSADIPRPASGGKRTTRKRTTRRR